MQRLGLRVDDDTETSSQSLLLEGLDPGGPGVGGPGCDPCLQHPAGREFLLRAPLTPEPVPGATGLKSKVEDLNLSPLNFNL